MWFGLLFRNHRDDRILKNLGQNLEDYVYNVTDSAFFYNDLEECDTVVSNSDDKN